MNRSFWTAASSSGFVINSPVSNFTQHNTAETLFNRLEAHGLTWKVYVQDPMPLSFTGLIHMPRVKDRLATNFVSYAEFEQDAANGTLPHFSLIEPNMLSGHSDYPAFGRSFVPDDVNLPMDPPSSIRGGEAFLARLYSAIRSAASPEGSNAYNTLLFIGWDEPGGTYDHVPPGPVPPPDPSAPAGQLAFKFDRSGYRVPAILVSPWVNQGIVINDQYRHTSMIATLRKVWGLGDAFTGRDAAAAPFDHLLSRETPRDPASWPDVSPMPVPQYHMDMIQMGKAWQDRRKRHPRTRKTVRDRDPTRADRSKRAPNHTTDHRRLAKHRGAGLPTPRCPRIGRDPAG